MITYKKDSKDNLQSSDSSMPVLAMCYDFDKTLTPNDMQAQGFNKNALVEDIVRVSNQYRNIHLACVDHIYLLKR